MIPASACGEEAAGILQLLTQVNPRKADLIWARMLGNATTSNARLTISLSDRPLVLANERTRRTNSWESLTVKAILVSPIRAGCFKRRACCR